MSKSPSAFDLFLIEVNNHLLAHRGPIFEVHLPESVNLFAVFLSVFGTDAEAVAQGLDQKTHTCTCCRHFLERFGHLVTVSDEGEVRSLLWDGLDLTKIPAPYNRAILHLAETVRRYAVKGVYLSSEMVWGTPSNVDKRPGKEGTWTHLAVRPPATLIFRERTENAHQAASRLREDFKLLREALDRYPISVAKEMRRLFEAGDLYRAEAANARAQWFAELHEKLATLDETRGRNFLWRQVAEAPSGHAHLAASGSVLAPILEGIKLGRPFAEIKRTYETMAAPDNYRRTQAAPTAGAIAQAEKIVEKMRSAGSLERRYLRLEEVRSVFWAAPAPLSGSTSAPATTSSSASPKRGGVFQNLQPKGESETTRALDIPARAMSFSKFYRDYLPSAGTVELLVPRGGDRFAALVTAANPDAPPILQWDREEARNPVSWTYPAGMDADFRKRVTEAGGQYEDVDIRASLIWSNRNDLDLHCATPEGDHIFYAAKRALRSPGYLDVDMNVSGESEKPVENIRWKRGSAPRGNYHFFVHNYRFHGPGGPSPFRIELEVAGERFYFEGIASPAGRETGDASQITVAHFTYEPGRKLLASDIRTQLRRVEPPAVTAEALGVVPGEWAAVAGIAPSPNLWGEMPAKQHGEHTFFLLQGAKPPEGARGFYTETLRSEYHGIRSVLEAHAAQMVIAGAEGPIAAGIGMNNQVPWDVTLRVNGRDVVRLDRWE